MLEAIQATYPEAVSQMEFYIFNAYKEMEEREGKVQDGVQGKFPVYLAFGPLPPITEVHVERPVEVPKPAPTPQGPDFV